MTTKHTSSYDPATNWRYEAYTPTGRHLMTYTNSRAYFDFQDIVGSERVKITEDGAHYESNSSLPFGDGQNSWGNDAGITGPTHFDGKDRDTETGNDYFGARYYSSAAGRWMSPDWSKGASAVPYADYSNPQTLNLYAFVENNPVLRADADGHCWSVIKWWEHLCNKQDGYGWRSNKQVEQAVEDDSKWLKKNGGFDPETLSAKQIIAIHDAAVAGKTSVSSDHKKFVWDIVSALPGVNPDWGKNRFIKELHDRGFVYEGPTNSGGGAMYKNPQTGEEVRVMPRPERTPFRGEPPAKFDNEWYYRYRSGPDQPWGPHQTLPDK